MDEEVEAALMRAGAQIEALQRHSAELRTDAERYRWLRVQHWSASKLAVASNPRASLRFGHDSPYGDRLDAAIDAAMKDER